MGDRAWTTGRFRHEGREENEGHKGYFCASQGWLIPAFSAAALLRALHHLCVLRCVQESWRDPAGASPAQVRGSAPPGLACHNYRHGLAAQLHGSPRPRTAQRYHPRQEPGAGKPHAGICAGGAQQCASLPRLSKKSTQRLSGLAHLGANLAAEVAAAKSAPRVWAVQRRRPLGGEHEEPVGRRAEAARSPVIPPDHIPQILMLRSLLRDLPLGSAASDLVPAQS